MRLGHGRKHMVTLMRFEPGTFRSQVKRSTAVVHGEVEIILFVGLAANFHSQYRRGTLFGQADKGKHHRLGSDATECGLWSGLTLFATHAAVLDTTGNKMLPYLI